MAKKQTFAWYRSDAPELQEMDISLAVREYLQNQIGQILKETESLEWTQWKHLDYSSEPRDSPKKLELKSKLMAAYPGLLTGPHGAQIAIDDDWLPVYVLSATVARTKLTNTPYKSDLWVRNVVWQHQVADVLALTFLNNHIDEEADISTFLEPEKSTNRGNLWATGHYGKGFIIATQYLHNLVHQHNAPSSTISDFPRGLSVRIGHSVVEVKDDLSSCVCCKPRLIAEVNDLTPMTPDDFATKYGITPHDAALEVASDYRHRLSYRLSKPHTIPKPEDSSETDHSLSPLLSESPLARKDEISITVAGISSSGLTHGQIFCGTYSLTRPSLTWKVPSTLFEFFRAPGDIGLLYIRGQIMPRNLSGLGRLGVNYNGTMEIAPNRVEVVKNDMVYERYIHLLKECIQRALLHMPDLGVELAAELLSCNSKDSSNQQLDLDLFTPMSESKATCKAAFESAWRRLHPDLKNNKEFYPFAASSPSCRVLISSLGFTPVEVTNEIMSRIIIPSGAYESIKQHAEHVFLKTKSVSRMRGGALAFRKGISEMFKWAKHDDVAMVDYQHVYPRVLWDERTGQFVIGLPLCHDSGGRQNPLEGEPECACWVGEALVLARETFLERAKKRREETGNLEMGDVFRAYAIAMGAESLAVNMSGRCRGSNKRKDQQRQGQASNSNSNANAKKRRSGPPRSESDMEESSSETEGHDSGNTTADSTLANSTSMVSESTAVSESTSNIPMQKAVGTSSPPLPKSHPLAESIQFIMTTYDAQVNRNELQRQASLLENTTRDGVRAQLVEERAKVKALEERISAIEAERDRTRELLISKWTTK